MRKTLLLSFFLILLFSCSSPKIQVLNISGYQEVQQGDTAKIVWDFANAKYVKILGEKRIFAPRDTFFFVVYNPVRLEIIAYQSENDSLSQFVYVVVSDIDKTPVQEKKVQRGQNIIPNLLEFKNENQSDYFLGFSQSSFNSIKNLKILREKTDIENNNFIVDFILLDENGNLVYNLDKFSQEVSLEVYQNCTSTEIIRQTKEFPFRLKHFGRINVHILLDNNLFAFLPNFKESLINGVKFLANDDVFSFYSYGNQLETHIPPQNFERAYWQIKNLPFNTKIELASIYKSLIELVNKIPEDTNTILILISKTNDNSSIIYTYDDVIESAKRKGICIYSVLIGNEGSPSLFKYLSSQTFGAFYHLLWDYSKQLTNIISEIILSNKYCYSTTFPNQLKDKNCKEITLKLIAKQGQNHTSNTYSIPDSGKAFFTDYQAISLYKFLDTTVSDEFLPILVQLAKLLKENPEVDIELIGNSSLDEMDYHPELISLSRANNARNELITLGVNPNQILVKGRGITKPLFLIEDDEFTKMLNRRTEIRWLHPSVLPFTIVVSTVESEEKAEKEILLWEKRGFKAYYDRILNKEEVGYRIVLWGFADSKAAEKTARLITKKFGVQSLVE